MPVCSKDLPIGRHGRRLAKGQTWALMGCHQDQLAGGVAALRCLVLCNSTMKVPSSSSRHICCSTTSLGAHTCSSGRTAALNTMAASSVAIKLPVLLPMALHTMLEKWVCTL